MWNMFKVINDENRICDIDIVSDVVLVSLLLTLNIVDTSF